jgi:hypothetical protein
MLAQILRYHGYLELLAQLAVERGAEQAQQMWLDSEYELLRIFALDASYERSRDALGKAALLLLAVPLAMIVVLELRAVRAAVGPASCAGAPSGSVSASSSSSSSQTLAPCRSALLAVVNRRALARSATTTQVLLLLISSRLQALHQRVRCVTGKCCALQQLPAQALRRSPNE